MDDFCEDGKPMLNEDVPRPGIKRGKLVPALPAFLARADARKLRAQIHNAKVLAARDERKKLKDNKND